MITALLSDPFLRAAVRRAALPEEDVFWEADVVSDALERGSPRLLIHVPEERHPLLRSVERLSPDTPVLSLTRATLKGWEASRRARGVLVGRVEDTAGRLRMEIRRSAAPTPVVDRTFGELTRASGRPLPPAFRGVARRVLEFPGRYTDLHDLAQLSDVSRGALKARFRRRGLPSPYTYLRWLRVVAVADALSDPDATTSSVAFRLGFTSGGNLCRFVQSTARVAPTRLRTSAGRTAVLAALARELLRPGHAEAWDDLDELFLRRVA